MSKRRKEAKPKKPPAPEDIDELEEGADDAEDGGEDAAAEEPTGRKTLGQMLAETRASEAAAAGGIRCPHCGCGHSAVARTWDIGGGRRRKRVCRHCGRDFPTTEAAATP
jgi:hypothetical protein